MKLIVPNQNRTLIPATSRHRVLQVFIKYPDKEFSLSDTARVAKVSKSHIAPVLTELVNSNLITIERLANILRVKANVKDVNYQRLKLISNLDSIYKSGIVDFLDQFFGRPAAIVLFGSYRYGKDGADSDIDIAIEVDAMPPREPDMKQFEEILGRKIQLHVSTRESFNENVFRSIANGIVLLGFFDVRK